MIKANLIIILSITIKNIKAIILSLLRTIIEFRKLKYQYHILKNGIKVVHQYAQTPVSHCGLMVGTGSRDELPRESGMAHFIEHMIFKGTSHRKAYHVLSRIENYGGDLNAFTTKEETCIYASFLSPYYERSIELFSDVAFNSIYPLKEMEKEKSVILDEINSYNDSPSEQIFDDFEGMLFKGHPLAENILGVPKTLNAFTRNDIFRFLKRNYMMENMVIASVGDIDFAKLIRLLEKHFENIETSASEIEREVFENYKPTKKIVKNGSYLSHLMIGNVAYSRNDKKRLPLLLLNNILGGPALNSRLNLSLREKYGYAYSIESLYQPYSDTGMFAIYLGTDNRNINKSIKVIKKELRLLREQKLGTAQFSRAKKQISGQLAIQYESRQNEMLSMAKSHLYRPQVKSLNDFLKEIDGLTEVSLMEVANEIFDENQLSLLIFEGKEND